MSLIVANVGGTLTGGASVTLTNAGNSAGTKASFVTPTHTRLAPRTVDILMQPAKTTNADPGVARGGMKIAFGDRLTEEGCCTVNSGTVIIDVGVRWPLNQAESLVDDSLEMLQALVFSPAFIAAVKTGILPA
jgi:hypothetical protein